MLGMELECVRSEKGISQNHKVYQKFERPRYEHPVDVDIDALEIRGCIRELEKATSCGRVMQRVVILTCKGNKGLLF